MKRVKITIDLKLNKHGEKDDENYYDEVLNEIVNNINSELSGYGTMYIDWEMEDR